MVIFPPTSRFTSVVSDMCCMNRKREEKQPFHYLFCHFPHSNEINVCSSRRLPSLSLSVSRQLIDYWHSTYYLALWAVYILNDVSRPTFINTFHRKSNKCNFWVQARIAYSMDIRPFESLFFQPGRKTIGNLVSAIWVLLHSRQFLSYGQVKFC